MKKHTFKQWYSLEEAAARFSISFGEKITILDILDYIISYKLDVYLNVDNNILFEVTDLENFINIENQDYLYKDYINKIMELVLQKRNVCYFYGKYKISSHASLLFIHANLINLITQSNLYIPNFPIFINEGNNIYFVYENVNNVNEISDIDEIISLGFIKIRFFKINDFYVHIDDLQKFENPETPQKANIEKQENTNLKIIGAMLGALTKKSEKKKLAAFPSEAELIKDILDHYSNVHGISKTTLENRFKEAKKILEQEK